MVFQDIKLHTLAMDDPLDRFVTADTLMTIYFIKGNKLKCSCFLNWMKNVTDGFCTDDNGISNALPLKRFLKKVSNLLATSGK